MDQSYMSDIGENEFLYVLLQWESRSGGTSGAFDIAFPFLLFHFFF